MMSAIRAALFLFDSYDSSRHALVFLRTTLTSRARKAYLALLDVQSVITYLLALFVGVALKVLFILIGESSLSPTGTDEEEDEFLSIYTYYWWMGVSCAMLLVGLEASFIMHRWAVRGNVFFWNVLFQLFMAGTFVAVAPARVPVWALLLMYVLLWCVVVAWHLHKESDFYL